MTTFRSRLFLAASAALILASCASPPPAPPPPVAIVQPPPPPPPPVALSAGVLQTASAYRSYVRGAAQISAAFADGAAVQQSLAVGVAYEPKQLIRGAIAYAAVVALQSPQFVAEVRTYAVDPARRRDLAARLRADPNLAAGLPSAAGAAGLISAALNSDAEKLFRAGEQVRQAAYEVQKQSWSKADVVGRDARLANAKQLSAQPISAPAEDVQQLASAVSGRDGAVMGGLTTTPALAPPYTPVINRGLALAALAALGEASDDQALQPLLEETSNNFCLNLSKLNVYQCLSVAKPYYEDVFCLGQHVLMDTGQCLSKAAGGKIAVAAPPPRPTPTPAVTTAAKSGAKKVVTRKAATRKR